MMFSIIIPAYNVNAFIHECLESVLWQDYSSWECICVDDGSTDGTGDILDEYAAKDNRFRIVHQANAGVSAARNDGLKIASGDWLLFLDGDDILLKGALSQLSRIIDNNVCDGISTWPIYRRLSERSSEWDDISANLSTAAVLVADRKSFLLGDRAILGYPHGRIYRRLLFGSVEFPVDVPMMEDFRHWVKALTIEAKWVRVDGSYYGYRNRYKSTVKTPTVGYFKSVFEMPQYVFPMLERDLHFSKVEMQAFWDQFRPSYVWHIRFLSHNWRKLDTEKQRLIIRYYRKFFALFKSNPIDFISILQMKLLSLGMGRITDSLYQHLEVAMDKRIRKSKSLIV